MNGGSPRPNGCKQSASRVLRGSLGRWGIALSWFNPIVLQPKRRRRLRRCRFGVGFFAVRAKRGKLAGAKRLFF